MSGHELPGIPGLLDVDLQLLLSDLPALPDFQFAPLRNSAPPRRTNTTVGFEPLNSNIEVKRSNERANDDTAMQFVSLIKPSDVLSAREAKKPYLAISELVDRSQEDVQLLQLPSFVSLSVVEKLPIPHMPEVDRPPKRLRLENDPERNLAELHRVLPRPAKKDGNKTRPVPLLPAMVTGLHEPPPSAGLLPSISDARPEIKQPLPTMSKMNVKEILAESKQVSNRRPPEAMLNSPDTRPADLPSRQIKSTDVDKDEDVDVRDVLAISSEKKNTKARRQRRKWTRQETDDLVAGVSKHGIGRWKQILTDAEYRFEDRTAVDLKDRYRVYSKDIDNSHILTQMSFVNDDGTHNSLASLGQVTQDISGILALRRKKRQPWTSDEDAALMKGVSRYGFQWSAIHADSAYDWKSRRATDLRDRVRTLYPEGYRKANIKPFVASTDKFEGSEQVAEVTKTGNDAFFRVETCENSSTNVQAVRDSQQNGQNGGSETYPPTNKLFGNLSKDNNFQNQQQSDNGGVTLPSLALDDNDTSAWDNRLPPLLDWEDIGV